MANYDFKTLSSHDFENCVRDLLQQELGIFLQTFKNGRDGGIDLRYSEYTPNKLVVQCKHYAESGFNLLYRELKNSEAAKVSVLKPNRYILCTSVGLSPSNKDKIVDLFSPYCKSASDVYGKDDLNNLLGRHPDVEKKNFKLWLSSSLVLSRIVHSKIYNYSETEIDRIKHKIKVYVQNDSFFRASKILDELHYCIIAGIPGIGKTTLAEILLVHHLCRGYEPIKIANDIAEAYAVLDQNKKQIFYYDDFLGQTALADKLNKNEDESLLRFLETVQKAKTTKLVLTTREYILAQAKSSYEKLAMSSFDYKKCVVDLEDYTKFHKAKILYNHVYFSKLQSSYRNALLQQQAYMKILNHPNFNPRIIEWMTGHIEGQGIPSSEYVERFILSLNNPSKIWQHAFEKQLSNPSRHLLLVLASMTDEVLLEDLESAFNSFYRYRRKKEGFASDPGHFRLALKELESNFIRINRTGDNLVVKFHNPSIRDFLNNFLLENPMYVEDLINSAIFFDQIAELWGGGLDRGVAAKTRSALEGLREDLGAAVNRLLDSKGCRLIDVYRGARDVAVIKERMPAPFETRAIYALDISFKLDLKGVTELIFCKLTKHLSVNPNRSALDLLLERIAKKGINPTSEFLSAVKKLLLDNATGLDEFESAMDFKWNFPGSISDEEIETLSLKFELEYERIVEGILENDSDPDQLKRYAEVLDKLGDAFGIDVASEYESLREQASEIEASYNLEDDGRYEGWREGARESLTQEDEIRSMFDGLREDN